jgi:predicted nucleic acid-binding protein
VIFLQRVYLDSNVFISYIKSEIGKPFRLMFQEVEDFFAKCPEKYILVLSELTFEEIEKKVHYSKSSTLNFFKGLEIETEVLEIKNKCVKDAGCFIKKGVHSSDALHSALAINSNCDILLTFNTKDFEAVKDLIELKEPEDLLC